MAFFDYKIAVGNNNAAGLVNIETIIPAGDIAFPSPIARWNYNPGERVIRGSGMEYRRGFPLQHWQMGTLTSDQYAYAKTTWCGGGYSGLVTVRTRHVSATYANYNAVLVIPAENELEAGVFRYFNVVFTFNRMVAI